MTGELEAAAADSLGDIFRGRKRKHPFTGVGKPCANCQAVLEGPYCHDCGQNADTHKRSILHLIWEAIEGLFHLDGRLSLTLPALFFRPGALAKDYMEGRIVRHVPPFRTFLVSLLLFIFAAEHAIHSAQHKAEHEREAHAAVLATPQGRAAEVARLKADALKDRDDSLKEAASDRASDLKEAENANDKAKAAADYDEQVKKTQERYAKALVKAEALASNSQANQDLIMADEATRKAMAAQIRSATFDDEHVPAVSIGDSGEVSTTTAPLSPEVKAKLKAHGPGRVHGNVGWLKEGIAKAIENPEYFLTVMFAWGHRLAVLLLPIVGLSLALVYTNKRQYFIYDHLLVAMNLLSFSFLTNAFGLVLPDVLKPWWFGLLTFWTPINLFQTVRGAYGSSVAGAILKTLIVWFVTVVSFSLLLAALAILALMQL